MGTFLLFGGCVMANRGYANALNGAMDVIRQYVEGTLNEEWQSSRGIRWSIVSEQTINTRGYGSDRRLYTTTWNHIGISCVKSAQELANQGAPAVVVVPAQQQFVQPMGQQVQYMQPVAQAPPQYVPNNQANQAANRYEVQAGQEEAQPF